MRTLAFCLVLACTASTVRAQSPILDLAPLRTGLSGWTNGHVGGMHVWMDRSVPLYFILPEVSEDSRLDALVVGAGVRFVDGSAQLAWRVEPLAVHITKPPWTTSFALVRYDRTGPDRLRADWLSVDIGPAFRSGRTVEMRLRATASFSTLAPGGVLFDLPSAASTGGLGSVEAVFRLQPSGTLGLEVSAGALAMLGGDDPTRSWMRSQVRWAPGARWLFAAGAATEQAKVAGQYGTHVVSFAAIRFIPNALAF